MKRLLWLYSPQQQDFSQSAACSFFFFFLHLEAMHSLHVRLPRETAAELAVNHLSQPTHIGFSGSACEIRLCIVFTIGKP